MGVRILKDKSGYWAIVCYNTNQKLQFFDDELYAIKYAL